MRIFYAIWFLFCSGGGYSAATFPAESAPPLTHAVITFPVAIAMVMASIWWESTRAKGRRFPAPSLRLTPWGGPIGFAVFLGFTFAFVGAWGIVLALMFDLPSPTIAVQVFAMGLGFVVGCYALRWLMPDRFISAARRPE
ncbi:hypothetical protein JNX00_21460 [Hydrogenophaga sp. YM1]|uniref:hypothetical protein n=1 Tax=Hydrogenophaga sp. YM1 TaxID=2806262 RepID=UPI0019570965|nr:hypothetical protein [Hydrogenophaga sp. YM1]QRR34165.1 hypothetical protein JNX00_21460 [Hydrogenophaga sp. YM1]